MSSSLIMNLNVFCWNQLFRCISIVCRGACNSVCNIACSVLFIIFVLFYVLSDEILNYCMLPVM